ncbi:redox-sensitive transcriptional activator SoxR [Marinicauda salina]|uniref:Redox-sensitive transcriptional activator SoxR n=1 Tax=Marinicauda salina TaxID=2135793 RepID=A0A2U2BVN7_9PROT|nr:redox-sensitive transcriptional activator SoxR [Marinicauda salina]PWE18091.1 redox-sensitive transcriptional activator SoxR [Marinicauda salina]
MTKRMTDLLAIGELARRTGLSVSAIRFYESQGLVSAMRNRGGQRRFPRSDIRRLSFILIAQQLGLTIAEIRDVLSDLPEARTPDRADWAKISAAIRTRIEARIAELTRMRDHLDGCIGCGCLSLDVCALYNPEDRVARKGPGPRILLGE